ncbi:MAG: hypothetical protein IJY83_08460 [Oscillospiraceae bacterium]|nr:hypothetical protein [Oscillospiraceae bacterium]
MTYFEEIEILKAKYQNKIKEICPQPVKTKGRDSLLDKKAYEIDIWYKTEIEKLIEKYNIRTSDI